MAQSSPTLKLTITPLKPSHIPSDDDVVAAGKALIESTSSWKPGKTYHKTVKTCWRPKQAEDGAQWHCRVSEHPPSEATFDQIWSKLGAEKALHEMEFIPEIRKVTKVKELSPSSAIWTLYYKFTPPLKARVFTVLQVIHYIESYPRTGMIVSIPIDLSEDRELAAMEESAIKGRYVSVERLLELENGSTEWRMGTSSTPGGSIPSFLVESSMASKISEDVPHFMNWLRKLPKPAETTVPELEKVEVEGHGHPQSSEEATVN